MCSEQQTTGRTIDLVSQKMTAMAARAANHQEAVRSRKSNSPHGEALAVRSQNTVRLQKAAPAQKADNAELARSTGKQSGMGSLLLCIAVGISAVEKSQFEIQLGESLEADPFPSTTSPGLCLSGVGNGTSRPCWSCQGCSSLAALARASGHSVDSFDSTHSEKFDSSERLPWPATNSSNS